LEEAGVTSPCAGGAASLPGWYRLDGEIARGGMGAILKGRDTKLGRDIAVKVLLETHQGKTELVQRFVEEAQIAGQLQHPGVVPVYELGALPNKTPYFTMKLVKGQTLAALLAQRGDQRPGTDLPRFVAIFEQVCQTLAYAHAHHVIHRDLKPANIMVGAFGEVQVMDWGLAKVLTEDATPQKETEAVEAVSVIQTGRQPGSAAEGSGPTQAGSVLGTPAYIAPEQARGEVELVDERADVFGLGAILCEILTGKPPFPGKSAEAMRLARRAELTGAFARLDGCGADVDLIGLAKHCLAAEASERPRDAGEVAGAVTAYQRSVAERLRQAEMERAQAQVKAAEERKRRKLALALAGSVLVTVLLASGGWVWFAEQQARQDRQEAAAQREKEKRERRDAQKRAARAATADRRRRATEARVEAALGEARLLLRQARQRPVGDDLPLREARGAVQRAADLARVGEVGAAVRRRVAAVRRKVKAETAAATRDRRLLAQLADLAPQLGRGQFILLDVNMCFHLHREYRRAFREYGLDLYQLPVEEVARRLRGRPRAVREEITAALLDWTDDYQLKFVQDKMLRARLYVLARAVGPDPQGVQDKLRAIRRRRQRQEPKEHRIWLIRRAFMPLADLMPGTDRYRLRQLARTLNPARTPAVTLCLLAEELNYAGDLPLALDLLRAARRARPGNVLLCQHLGRMLTYTSSREKLIEALGCFEAVRALRPQRVLGLAGTLIKLDQPRQAEALLRLHLGANPEDLSAIIQLAKLLEGQRHYDEAAIAFRRYFRISARRYPHAPKRWKDVKWAFISAMVNVSHKGKLNAAALHRRILEILPHQAVPYHFVANDLLAEGKSAQAEALIRKSIKAEPDNNLGYAVLIMFLCNQNRLQEAVGVANQAFRELKTRNEEYTDLAAAFNHLAKALERRNLPAGPTYRQAVLAYRQSIQRGTIFTSPSHWLDYSKALEKTGEKKAAVAAYRESLKLIRQYDSMDYYNLGCYRAAHRDFVGAEAAYRKAIELKPHYAQAHCNLGIALYAKGRLDEAIACYRKAIALDPKLVQAHTNLGLALAAKGRLDEAIACSRKAIALDPKLVQAHYILGILLVAKGRADDAIASYRKAIALDPGYAEAHCNLGHALQRQGRFAQALAALKRGHLLGRKRPDWRYPSARWVRQCRRLLELETKLAAVLAGTVRLEGPGQRLDFARICASKQRHAAAARLFAEAFQRQPKLASDLAGEQRYNAACAAALAAAGKGIDAGKLDAKEKARLRGQALVWLRADLALWGKRLETGTPADRAAVRHTFQHWQRDPDLTGVRGNKALGMLPEAERAGWRKLWAEVETLLKKAGKKPGKR
jgi:serine/threonine-protein kinase